MKSQRQTSPAPRAAARLKATLRAVDASAGDVVIATEQLRARLREALLALDDLTAEPPPASAPIIVPTASGPRPVRQPSEPAGRTGSGPRFMRAREVARCTGLSRATIWRLQRDGRFPRCRRLSTNAVGWLSDEVEEWVRSRGQRG